jgi:ribosomal protein S18 acetylase RimI-like enzyme
MMRTPSPARLTSIDWQTLPAERVRPLYAAEIERWSSALEWDTGRDWEDVERGRQIGTVSGVAVADETGAIVGWCYYLVHKRALQVGSFIASTDAVAQLMLDAVLSDERRASVDTVTLFAFADAPNLAAALRLRGLAVDRYWYLGRELERLAPPRVPDVRRWRVDDLQATAELLGRAYEGRDEARPFAPRGMAEEWSDYIAQLTTGTGCGRLMSDVSVCIPGGPNRLMGVALVTRIADGTAHLVQLAVDPQLRGRRLGKQLLEVACAAANQAGCGRMTLFVGGRNSRARSLYESSRFESMASFLAAGSLQPRRSTSVAPGSAVMTRR